MVIRVEKKMALFFTLRATSKRENVWGGLKFGVKRNLYYSRFCVICAKVLSKWRIRLKYSPSKDLEQGTTRTVSCQKGGRCASLSCLMGTLLDKFL